MRGSIHPLRASPSLYREEKAKDYEVKIFEAYVLIENYHAPDYISH